MELEKVHLFDITPAPDFEDVILFDQGYQIGIMLGWGMLRHSKRWKITEFSGESARDYFQAWIDKSKHRIPSAEG